MQHVELATTPQTAPRHRPSFGTRHLALDHLLHSAELDASVYSRAIGWLQADWISLADPVFLDVPTYPTTLTLCIDYELARGFAQIWSRLGTGLLERPMYPATRHHDTQATHPDQVRSEEQQLDAAFAAVMASTTEDEELSESEHRPKLRFRYTR